MLDTIRKYIKDKNILILGFGREGRSTLKLIKQAGGSKSIAIADMNQVSVDDSSISCICGMDYQKNLDDFDVIFKSPGIVLEKAVSQISAKLLSQTQVFFERYRNQIIGITGTKGKSTTTTLIYNILKEAGRKTVLAGNIGIPAFDVWEDITQDTIICFEMSSHQLEYMTVAPHTAVYLNIHEEHLDHYKTMEKYVAAKENIYRNQVTGDVLYVNELIKPSKANCKADVFTVGYDNADINISGNTVYFRDCKYVIPVDDIKLLGEHNYYNIAVAYAVMKQYGITDDEFTRGLVTYETLPHRLQFVGCYDGIKFYDDSISTICDTSISALKSLKDADTILIGGMDRGIDYSDLINFLSEFPINNIILMEATGRRIFDEINEKYDFNAPQRLHVVEHLEDAVRLAKKITAKSRSCVMSPAAASYGIFKNFEERGNAFCELIKRHENEL